LNYWIEIKNYSNKSFFMKKVIAIAAFAMITFGSAVLFTSCEPGQKTTDPNNTTDTSGTRNSNGSMDSTVIADTSHIKNPGK
jgi:L-asparagine transporter-like permease